MGNIIYDGGLHAVLALNTTTPSHSMGLEASVPQINPASTIQAVQPRLPLRPTCTRTQASHEQVSAAITIGRVCKGLQGIGQRVGAPLVWWKLPHMLAHLSPGSIQARMGRPIPACCTATPPSAAPYRIRTRHAAEVCLGSVHQLGVLRRAWCDSGGLLMLPPEVSSRWGQGLCSSACLEPDDRADALARGYRRPEQVWVWPAHTCRQERQPPQRGPAQGVCHGCARAAESAACQVAAGGGTSKPRWTHEQGMGGSVVLVGPCWKPDVSGNPCWRAASLAH